MSQTPIPKVSKPANRVLLEIGITTLEQLSEYSEKDLLALHGMGPKGIQILKEAMKEKNISFKK
ncbi:MAG: DNA-binding protein [Candidatus Gracilibacteria bacterium]